MKEILISSSVLILALFLLRRLFRRTVSRRLQYALWGLAALRLLLPVSLPAMEHNVLTAAEPVARSVEERMDRRPVYVLPVDRRDLADYPLSDGLRPGDTVPTGESFGYPVVNGDGATVTKYADKWTMTQTLTYLWHAGIAVTAVWFLACNLRFWRKLRKVRTPYSVEHCPYPVYLVAEGLPSPCLFGLFRPAVYLTPAAAASEESLRHVLAHETTHARHWDPLWSLVRCVCLTVYWFNPLVWAAALASKTDCELACDEGALKALGEAERIPYGQTLLRLIPVRKCPSSPLLTATTMTSGKRQLKDRITRIAENRRTLGAAVLLALALTLTACAATFTAAKPPEETAPVPLGQEELLEFEDLIFSREDARIRRQFLSSFYETPEDIDLYELFYNGTGQPETLGDGERQALVDAFYEGQDPEVDLTKLPAGEIDQILRRYAGLTLAETNSVGMDGFQYLPDYDAYYHFHGDTNAIGPVTFLSGEREGTLVRLYYDAVNMWFGGGYNNFGEGYACLTLEEVPGEAVDGFSYRFVSNQPAENLPVHPTVYPEGDPVLTIPLSDSVSVTPQVVEQEAIFRQPGLVPIAGYILPFAPPWEVEVYPAANGEDAYACLVDMTDSSRRAYRFLTVVYDVWADVADIQPFRNVLGYENGFVLTYQIANGVQRMEYYTMDMKKDSLQRLCAYNGFVKAVDLDGDGQKEIFTRQDDDEDGPRLLFSRDGEIRCFEIGSLLRSAWPEAKYPDYYYSGNDRFLSLYAQVPMPAAIAYRKMYFDGESLLLYKDGYADGVNTAIDAPAYAVAAARDRAEAAVEWWNSHTGVRGFKDGQYREIGSPASWDGYRIKYLKSVDVPAVSARRPEVTAEVYELLYELHTTTPEKVIMAGGTYLDEDGWVGGSGIDDRYLVFLPNGTDAPTLLESHIASDTFPEAPSFAAGVAKTLVKAYALHYPEIDPQVLLYMFSDNCYDFLNDLGEENETEQMETLDILCKAALTNGREDSYYFDHPMENLAYSTSNLTDAGKSAYSLLLDTYDRLKKASATLPMDPEELLDRFTADPAAFLQQAAESLNARDALALLARYYDTGAADKRERFSAALHSVQQTGLGAEATEAYEILRTSCNLPGPPERDGLDEAGIWNAVNDWAAAHDEAPGVKSFQLLHQEIDDEETARYVRNYTASLYANAWNYPDDYISRAVAVQVVYDVTIDPANPEAAGAAGDAENGVNARWLYVYPPEGFEYPNEGWFVADSMGCRVPERFRAMEELPFADIVQTEARVTTYRSFEAAYEAVVTRRQSLEGSSFQVLEEVRNENGDAAISWCYTGTPHGTDGRLSLITAKGAVYDLPLPPRSAWGLANPAEKFAFSGDGQTLTYIATFPDTELTVDGSAVIHRAGTYRYTLSLDTMDVELTIE